jgi:DNA replication protein DnaC
MGLISVTARCPLCEYPIAASVDDLVTQPAFDRYLALRFHRACLEKACRCGCHYCRGVLTTDDAFVVSRHSVYHKTCLQKALDESREQQQKEREKRKANEIELCVNRALRMLPAWDHARIESPVFVAKVDRRLQAFARNWVSGSALLLGPSGCGKTTSAIALNHRRVDDARKAAEATTDGRCPELTALGRIYWVDGFALANCRRNHPLGQGDPPVIVDAKSANLTIIDELGFEGRDASADIIDLVNSRYAGGHPTIATSGATLAEFTERYGGALVRRLAEKGIGQLVDCHAVKGK